MPETLELIWPDWPAPAQVRACSSTRAGGISAGPYASLNLGDHVQDDPQHVAANRARLLQAAALPAPPAWLRQVHGVTVAQATAPAGVTADGRYSATPGVVCAVLAADCLPVLLCSAPGDEVAALHCGWRGLAGGIIAAGVARFRAPPAQLLAWLGPAIGPQSYVVGTELRAALPACAQGAFGVRNGATHLDLYTAARALLQAAGVHQVHGGGACTASAPESFFSYRRDGVTGRMATLIWISDARSPPSQGGSG